MSAGAERSTGGAAAPPAAEQLEVAVVALEQSDLSLDAAARIATDAAPVAADAAAALEAAARLAARDDLAQTSLL